MRAATALVSIAFRRAAWFPWSSVRNSRRLRRPRKRRRRRNRSRRERDRPHPACFSEAGWTIIRRTAARLQPMRRNDPMTDRTLTGLIGAALFGLATAAAALHFTPSASAPQSRPPPQQGPDAGRGKRPAEAG